VSQSAPRKSLTSGTLPKATKQKVMKHKSTVTIVKLS